MNIVNKRDDLAVDEAQLRRVERFLYQESALLDARQYSHWCELLTSDVRYKVTAKLVREATIGDLEFALFDENAAELKQRVAQISNPRLTHAENPPSTTRRFITNVLVNAHAESDELRVRSNILVYRSTPDLTNGALYSAARDDLLRLVDNDFRIASRTAALDQAVLFGGLSILL